MKDQVKTPPFTVPKLRTIPLGTVSLGSDDLVPLIRKRLIMASQVPETVEVEQQSLPKLQIYPATNTGVSPYWRDKYERDAKKYWDIFYKRHKDKFFKDRHYLDKEWGHYFTGKERRVLLEVGCGAGNTIYPLIVSYPDVFVHACDFSPRAIDLVKAHEAFTESRINAFVCDLTSDDLSKQIVPSSVDIVTMIFVLSAVSPEKMPLVLQNIRNIVKPNGHVLFRDYATGDLAQERLTCRDQKISENFYVRGDGTQAFYFTEEYLGTLFRENGFDTKELGLCCKQVHNRSRKLVMNRRWIQAVFCFSPVVKGSSTALSSKENILDKEIVENEVKRSPLMEPASDTEFDMLEGMAVEMFGISVSYDEIVDINLGDVHFKIKVLPKEYQHTCTFTGLMLWESARLMTSLLAGNPAFLEGKRVLELGCGCAGICSMVAARFADLVVATDGDSRALDLLNRNIASNLSSAYLDKLIVRPLEWGNPDHIAAIKEVNDEGFDIIMGTDVTYILEAIVPLFSTAKSLISSDTGLGDDLKPALILCHVPRSVDEPSILSAASRFGFELVEKWHGGNQVTPSQGIMASWFSTINSEHVLPITALSLLYFHQTSSSPAS
ncbi:hypothetical protein Nepgr_000966 [Nepenthes gracilis]|uniref:Methyltransferase type 12 domain-containing protein n=1 Tax=Nepenthes gracilis TaxID=150966 RepID=A0AAD3P4J0_NEPGR|nr:hypothetical protein Nepgr_000966 [Nepenthes gracilis]